MKLQTNVIGHVRRDELQPDQTPSTASHVPPCSLGLFHDARQTAALAPTNGELPRGTEELRRSTASVREFLWSCSPPHLRHKRPTRLGLWLRQSQAGRLVQTLCLWLYDTQLRVYESVVGTAASERDRRDNRLSYLLDLERWRSGIPSSCVELEFRDYFLANDQVEARRK